MKIKYFLSDKMAVTMNENIKNYIHFHVLFLLCVWQTARNTHDYKDSGDFEDIWVINGIIFPIFIH